MRHNAGGLLEVVHVSVLVLLHLFFQGPCVQIALLSCKEKICLVPDLAIG